MPGVRDVSSERGRMSAHLVACQRGAPGLARNGGGGAGPDGAASHRSGCGWHGAHRLVDRLVGWWAADRFRVARPASGPSGCGRFVATIAIRQQRAVHAREELSQQLQTALNSRVIIEQAKGVLAERQQTDMSTAFKLPRGHARSTNQQLSEVAGAVVAGELGTDQLQASHRPNTAPTA